MADNIYKPFGKVLMRADDGQAIAQSCSKCGRFCLDTATGLCAGCYIHHDLLATVRVLGNAIKALEPRERAK